MHGYAYRSFIVAVVWFLYMNFLFPYAIITIGECEGTPGVDYSYAFVIIPVYLLLFGGLLFYVLPKTLSVFKKIILIVLFLILLPFVYASISFVIFSTDTLHQIAHTLNSWQYLYYYGCYGDVEVQETPIWLLTALLLFGTFILFYKVKLIRKRY